VIIIDALMNLRLKAHIESESMICNILLSTEGSELTNLKTLCDAKGKATNLHKLLFSDIKSNNIRNKILQHFQAQATALLAQTAHNKQEIRRKILSDVDDTLFSSGGRFPAGLDTKYSRHTIYPGVLQLYLELDLGYYGGSANVIWPESRPGNLIFLSARPHVYKDKSEAKSYEIFEALHVAKSAHRLHCLPTLLSGSLDSGLKSFRKNFDPMAAMKFSNFEQIVALYPEFSFVWLGDNGQGDVLCAELMVEKYPSKIEATFMHQVTQTSQTPGFQSLSRYEKVKIKFFDTYIEAALLATEMNLIHPTGLRRVAVSAANYFAEIRFSMSMEITDARRNELNNDIERANQLLKREKLPPVPLIHADCIFSVGSTVISAFGIGLVISFEPINGIYCVQLTSWHLKNGNSAVWGFFHGSALRWYRKGEAGAAVFTKFGTGIITEIREQNGIHVVLLTQWRLHTPSVYKYYNSLLSVAGNASPDGKRSLPGSSTANSSNNTSKSSSRRSSSENPIAVSSPSLLVSARQSFHQRTLSFITRSNSSNSTTTLNSAAIQPALSPDLSSLDSSLLSVKALTGLDSEYAVAYLQPDELSLIAAAVGDTVTLNHWGTGIISLYRMADNIYEIQLKATGYICYCGAEYFQRVEEERKRTCILM
jgi:hypothetical protein